jgi:hypothetical protein
MSALKQERDEEVRAVDAVEITDCGQASERTKGGILLIFNEAGSAPFNWFLLG